MCSISLYVKHVSAIHAAVNLHNNILMDSLGHPLIVMFADNKNQRQQQHMQNVKRQEILAAMGVGPTFSRYQIAPPMANATTQW